MEGLVEVKKGEYLSDAQKEIKLKVMDKLNNALSEVVRAHPEVEFTNETLTDLVISCICMYMRDQLAHFFLNSNALNIRNETMDGLFAQIKVEVNLIVDAEMNVDGKRTVN